MRFYANLSKCVIQSKLNRKNRKISEFWRLLVIPIPITYPFSFSLQPDAHSMPVKKKAWRFWLVRLTERSKKCPIQVCPFSAAHPPVKAVVTTAQDFAPCNKKKHLVLGKKKKIKILKQYIHGEFQCLVRLRVMFWCVIPENRKRENQINWKHCKYTKTP